MVLLDEVSSRFPRLQVRGFLDSPYYLDVPSFSPKFAGFQPQHSQAERCWFDILCIDVSLSTYS